MTQSSNPGLGTLLAELSVSTAQSSLKRTLTMLKGPNVSASIEHIRELSQLGEEITNRLAEAERAKSAQLVDVAEDGYAQAIDLMVELRLRSAGLRRETAATAARRG